MVWVVWLFAFVVSFMVGVRLVCLFVILVAGGLLFVLVAGELRFCVVLIVGWWLLVVAFGGVWQFVVVCLLPGCGV